MPAVPLALERLQFVFTPRLFSGIGPEYQYDALRFVVNRQTIGETS